MIVPPITAEFGRMMRLLSGVVRIVEKTCTSSTEPATPPTSTNSPALKGRKRISMTPDAKLDSEPCSAKPIARPAAPTIAMNEPVWMPISPSAETITNASSAKYTRFEAKLASVTSMCARSITRLRMPRMILATIQPTISVSRAKPTLGPCFSAPSFRYSRIFSQSMVLPPVAESLANGAGKGNGLTRRGG